MLSVSVVINRASYDVLGYWTNLCISNVPGKKVLPVWNYASCVISSASAEDPLRAL